MKNLFLTVLTAILIFSSVLNAQDQDFTLINKTGLSIDQLFISPSDTQEWQEDVLGVDILPADSECEVLFHSSEESCIWDMKIVDEEGDEIVWDQIDLCKAVAVILYWADGKAWAEIEEVTQE